MATTPNYGWVTPAPTDFVTDLPADFETFADAADLTVKGIDDRVAGLEVITTEGDLIVGDATGDPSRLPLGTTGQVLSSDGTTATWTTPATGVAPVLTPNLSGQWVGSFRNTDSGSTNLGVTEDVTHYSPVYLPTCTLDRIGTRVSAYTSTGNLRLGIYQNGTDNRPANLLLDAGTVSVTAVATYEITINQAITEGWYWLAINRQSGTYNLYGAPFTFGYPIFQSSNTLANAIQSQPNQNGYTQTGVTGAFANAGTLTNNSSIALAAVRIA